MGKWIMSSTELANSPSRRDGMSAEEEKKLLRETNWYVQQCGQELKLPPVAIMTAQTFLNRFYALQSFRKYDSQVTAQACLFLAAKVEESPTKLHKIVTTSHAVRTGDTSFVPTSKGFSDVKQQVLTCERAVLYTIDFDVDVTLMSPISPFSEILARLLRANIVPAEKKQSFGSTGIKFISDSLRTNLCLQFEPKKIASACALLAVVFLRLYPHDNKDLINALFKILNISERTIKTISSSMVEIYLDTPKCDDLIIDLSRHHWISPDLAARRINASGNGVGPPPVATTSYGTVPSPLASPLLPSPAYKPTTTPPPPSS